MNGKKVDVSDNLETLLGIDPEERTTNSQVKSDKHQSALITDDLIETGHLDSSKTDDGNQNVSSTEVRALPKTYLDNPALINCPPGIREIPITAKAFDDIIMVAQAVNELGEEKFGENSEKLEVYMYVLADAANVVENGPTTISEIFIPPHTASETRVKVQESAMFEVQNHIRENNKILLGWAHSHGHFDVYSSATDEKNHLTLLHETSNLFKINNYPLKYIYGITVVESGERYGVILTQYPCGHIEHRVDKEFTIIGDRYTEREYSQRYDEIKSTLENQAALIQPTEKQSEQQIIDTMGEELLETFVRNLRKAKGLVFDDLPDLSEKDYSLVQNALQKYEDRLIDNTEESFNKTSQNLMRLLKNYKEEV